MIDQKKIMSIAQLARLKMSSDEATYYGEQLAKVLTHFDQISKIDTTNVEPLVNPLEADFFDDTAYRADVEKNNFQPEEMLENAPEKMGNLFKVPPVVG